MKSVDDTAISGIIYLNGARLPFDGPTLLYYLMFSPTVDRIKETSRLDTSEIRFDRLRDSDTFFILELRGKRGHIPIADNVVEEIVASENERRPHDVLRLLEEVYEEVYSKFYAVHRFLDWPYKSKPYDILQLPGILLEVTPDKRSGKAHIAVEFPLFSEDEKAYEAAMNKLIEFLPEYHICTDGPYKLILRDFIVSDKYRIIWYDGVEPRISIFPDGYTHTLETNATSKLTIIDLSYWEVYVEPWLHLPHLLLNRPNPKLADEILAYWNEAVGAELNLRSLEKVILGFILADE